MNIYILAALSVGRDITDILKRELHIQGIIGLAQRKQSNSVSGYVYIGDYCKESKLQFIPVESYSLKKDEDRERLLGLDIDILIVAGWQRLIPEWLISHCKICAIGAHGSPHGITGGRGRSPQNWALLVGKKRFYISIFKIDKGIDSGAVIDTKVFQLSENDNIRSSYYKASWLIAKMIIDNVRNKNIQRGYAISQISLPKYLPQRLAEDGEIDWERSSSEIYNFVRALTRPYPGAFTRFLGNKCLIWEAMTFENLDGFDQYHPGQIIKIFHLNNDFLVKTSDEALLVTDYEIERLANKHLIRENLIFESADFQLQMDRIIQRHYRKYPNNVVVDDILQLGTNEKDR